MHGNLNTNDKPHHLYEIRDSVDNDVFKYGISHDPIESDGLSERCRDQVSFINLAVNWLRFFGRTIIFDIPNRILAKQLERKAIDEYEKKNGRKPRGNLD